MSSSSRGHARERQVVKKLREDGWLAFRAPGSLGVADVVALKAGERPMLVEVKTDARDPWSNFGPEKRAALFVAAFRAGAEPWFCWWPAGKSARWFAATEWPVKRGDVAA